MAQVFWYHGEESLQGVKDGDIVKWEEGEDEYHGVWWEGRVIEFDEMMPECVNITECVKITDTNGFTPYHWFQKAHVSNYIRFSDDIISRTDLEADECTVEIGGKEYTFIYSACGDGDELRFWVEREDGPIFYSFF